MEIKVHIYDPHVNLKGKVLSEALVRVQELLEITNLELTEIIRISQSNIDLFKNGSTLDPNSPEGQRALYLIKIYKNLDTIVGGNDLQSIAWLKSHNDHLRDKPINLLKTENGLEKVFHYLEIFAPRQSENNIYVKACYTE